MAGYGTPVTDPDTDEEMEDIDVNYVPGSLRIKLHEYQWIACKDEEGNERVGEIRYINRICINGLIRGVDGLVIRCLDGPIDRNVSLPIIFNEQWDYRQLTCDEIKHFQDMDSLRQINILAANNNILTRNNKKKNYLELDHYMTCLDDVSLNKLTTAQLMQRLRAHNLQWKGLKHELIARWKSFKSNDK